TQPKPPRPGPRATAPTEPIATPTDPVQPPPPLPGPIDNKAGKPPPGQFTPAPIPVATADDEVKLPTAAVLEGDVVFVQPDPKKTEFILRPVQVTRWTKDFTYVRSKVRPQEKTPSGQVPQPLLVDEWIVTHGAIDLQRTFE